MQRLYRWVWIISLLELLVFSKYVVASTTFSRSMLKKPGQLVFMVQASKAKIVRRTGRFYLRMENISPNIIYLSDPPRRTTGMVNTQTFLTNYAKAAYMQQPHAALVYAEHPKLKRGIRIRFAISHPKQESENVWIFQMRVVSGVQALRPTQEMTSVTLIIDNDERK